jgi:hypothetical protein
MNAAISVQRSAIRKSPLPAGFAKSYRELLVRQRSIGLSDSIYKLAASFLAKKPTA